MKINPVKVSVIIPVYRTEKHLSKCIDSILASTMEEIEVICINDGSPDGCGGILEAYERQDSRVVVVNQSNSGQGTARNRGLGLARGEAIHFCDSDDSVAPEMYAEMYGLMVENRADIVCCGTNITYEVYSELKDEDHAYYAIKFSGMVEAGPDVLLATDVAVWNKLFRRAFLTEKNIQFPVSQFEDVGFFWYWMTSYPIIFYTKERYYNYVRRPHSFMSSVYGGNLLSNQAHFMNVMDAVYQRLDTSGMLALYRVAYWKFFHDVIVFQMHYASRTSQQRLITELSRRLKGMKLDYLDAPPYRHVYQNLMLISHGQNPISLPGQTTSKPNKSSLYFFGVRIGRLRVTESTWHLRILGVISINSQHYEY